MVVQVTVLDIMHMCPTAVSLQTLISDCIAWGSTVPHALPSPPIPFIGYEPELKDALSFLSHTPPSSSSCLAIAGPVGCGMTSFLASLVHRLIESDANATVHFVDFQVWKGHFLTAVSRLHCSYLLECAGPALSWSTAPPVPFSL